jgi:hypothetical protein
MAKTYVPVQCIDPAVSAVVAAHNARNQTVTYVPKQKDYVINPFSGSAVYGAGSVLNSSGNLNIPDGMSAGLPKLSISEWKNILLGAHEHINDLTSGINNSQTMMAMFQALKSGYKPVMFRELYKASWNSLKLSAFSAVMAGLDTDLGKFVIGGFPEAMQSFKIIFDAYQDGTFKEQFIKGLHQYYGNKTGKEVAAETAREGLGGLKIFMVSLFQGALNTLPMNSGEAIRETIGNVTEEGLDKLINSLQSGLIELNQIDKILVDDPMQGRAHV